MSGFKPTRNARRKMLTEEVGARMKKERVRLQIKVEQMPHFCDISRSTYSNWERGEYAMDLVGLFELKNAGFDIWFLLTGEYGDVYSRELSATEKKLVSIFRLAKEPARNRALDILFHEGSE